ncbi:thiolase family protein [Streptomyces sp. MAI_2237]
MHESVILAGACTPGGDLFTGLGTVCTNVLEAIVIESALDRAQVCIADVDCLITGHTHARRTAHRACLPDRVPVISVSATGPCSLHPIALADRLIRSGQRQVVVVSGVDLALAGPDRDEHPTPQRRAAAGGLVLPRDIARALGPGALSGLGGRADCAAAVVLMRRSRAERLGLPWLARVVSAPGTTGGPSPSSYQDAERAVSRALRRVPAKPPNLSLVRVGAQPADGPQQEGPAPRRVFDTAGMRTALLLARVLARQGHGLIALGTWGDHPAEAVVVSSGAP